jgi:hypothetical protein
MLSRDPASAPVAWGQMIGEHDVEEQCARIADWLKDCCRVQGIALSLQDKRLGRSFLYHETVPEDILRGLHEFLPRLNPTEKTAKGPTFLALEGSQLCITDGQKRQQSPETIVLADTLATHEHHIGALALVTDSDALQPLLDKELSSCWFTPLVSSLLDNSISHEEKDNKIRMLNLYQTVSSSLAYVGDLFELLTTIMSVVTSELLCEEGSVLFFDEESHEFEFFTAVGETGAELQKVRFPADKGIAGRALREQRMIVVNDVKTSPDFYQSIDQEHDFQTRSILAVPLTSGEERVGVIEAINKIGDKLFDREDGQVLAAIADEVALAVKNARLFEYVVDSYCKIRQGLSSCKGCKRPLKSWTPCIRYLSQQ